MSIEGVLERLNIPIVELLALYGKKEELTDEVEDERVLTRRSRVRVVISRSSQLSPLASRFVTRSQPRMIINMERGSCGGPRLVFVLSASSMEPDAQG